jgi:lysophospholipid acyltransferase (LPLAT)-like uncharacterized protein
MTIKLPMAQKALGLLAAVGGRLWSHTIDWKAVYFDPTVDTVHPRFTGRYVYVGWHEYMVMPILLRGHRRMLALASQHGDGAIISRAMRHLGWGVSRGSTSRGGTAALLRFLRDDRRCPNLTPDGPRGPRRVLQQGPIFLASKLGLPIVCVGYAYDRPWRLRSWDRFAIPRPFTRGRAVFGPPLRVPERLDRNALESHRVWFEQLLNWLTGEAETWAESGVRRRGEMPMLVGEAPPMLARQREPSFALPESLCAAWDALGPRPIAAAA